MTTRGDAPRVSERPYGDSPVMRRGRPFEEQTVGAVFEHPWTRTVLESESFLFTTATIAFGRRYLSREDTPHDGSGRIQINPMLVFSVVFGLSVEDLSEIGGPFLGGEDLTFGTPVFAGDTLSARSVVLAARESASKPEAGIVTWETVGVNQHGREVLRYKRTNIVRKGHARSVIEPVEGYAEDFTPGLRFWHARSKSIGDVELALLTPLVMNSASGHFSDEVMADTEFGQRINFGGQTLALVIGLASEDSTAHLVHEVGLNRIRFDSPVLHGDTVSAHSEILAAGSYDQYSDDVVFRHVGVNQRGSIVCQVDRTVRLRRRVPRSPGVS